jgi:hypothetical protein
MIWSFPIAIRAIGRAAKLCFYKVAANKNVAVRI